MSLEHLLLWLSGKGQGSWSQFRGAVEELCAEQDHGSLETDEEGEGPARVASDLPVYQRARFALQCLGHVEFFSNQAEQGWRVVPPTLALLPGSPGEGLLCGARSPDLLERLATDFEIARTTSPGMPDRIAVRGSSEAVTIGATHLNLLVQEEASTAMLSAVPGVCDPRPWSPAALPDTPGWTVHRFSSSRLRWAESTGRDAQMATKGLFRFVMQYQRFYYLRWKGRSYRVPVQVGKYAVMRKRRGVLLYDASRRALSVPAVGRPPILIERALVLCAGFLPSFDPSLRRLEYANVPPEITRLAARLLRQQVSK